MDAPEGVGGKGGEGKRARQSPICFIAAMLLWDEDDIGTIGTVQYTSSLSFIILWIQLYMEKIQNNKVFTYLQILNIYIKGNDLRGKIGMNLLYWIYRKIFIACLIWKLELKYLKSQFKNF